MKITRIYTGNDGESHFEEMQVDFFEAAYGKLSQLVETQGVIFGEVDKENEIDWHNPPCKQYVLMLRGIMEIETGHGVKKSFKEGEILLAEDLTGRGHKTRALSEGVRNYMAIPLK